jgi:hypothetical protein
MDQGTLVSELIEDGQRYLERLDREGVPVLAACWIKKSENGRWYLYLITPLVTEESGTRPAYLRINEVYQQMPQPFEIGMFQTKVVGPAEPLAQAVLRLQKPSRGKGPRRYDGYILGDVPIDGAYIYPPPPAA